MTDQTNTIDDRITRAVFSCNANVDQHERSNSLVIYQSAVYADPRTRDTSNQQSESIHVSLNDICDVLCDYLYVLHQLIFICFLQHLQNCYFRFTLRSTYIFLPSLHDQRLAVATINRFHHLNGDQEPFN